MKDEDGIFGGVLGELLRSRHGTLFPRMRPIIYGENKGAQAQYYDVTHTK